MTKQQQVATGGTLWQQKWVMPHRSNIIVKRNDNKDFSSIIDMIDIRCDGDALTTPWAGPFRKIVANSVSLRLKSSHYVSISICCCKSAFNIFNVDLFLFYISVTMLECWSKVWQRTWRKIGYYNITMTRWCAHTEPYKGVVCQSDLMPLSTLIA